MRVRAACAASSLAVLSAVCSAQTLVDPSLEYETVASGLSLPTGLLFLGPDDFLVTQKNDGRVRRVTAGAVVATVLDVDVNFNNEQGLLSIVADPDFAHNGWVYLYYTASGTGSDSSATDTAVGNRVVRYTWDGAALSQPRLVLDLPAATEFPGNPPGPHNGGVTAFGPDDRLYVLIGDLARGNFEAWTTRTQNRADGAAGSDTSVILRVDGGGAGPPDNPFRDSADPSNPVNRYFAYGIRNSFGIAFDPVGGSLWQSENGPTDLDEINRVFPGFNGGWFRVRGMIAEDAEGPSDLWIEPGATYADPQFVWRAPVAPTALTFVRGRKLGCNLEGDLIAGDAVCRQLYRFEPSADRTTLAFQSAALQDRVADNVGDACVLEQSEILFGAGPDFDIVTDLEIGPDGALYLVRLTTGTVGRVRRAAGTIADADGDGVDDACDCDAGDAGAFASPGEVPRLRLSGSTSTTIGWNDQALDAGEGTTYRVVTGTIAALRSAGWTSACTLADGSTQPDAVDPRVPSGGEVLWYLAVATNGCGTSGYGPGRAELDATIPEACP